MNLVTSTRRSDARNFGFDELMEYGARYDRMEEFVDACRELWNNAGPDIMLWDRATGRVGDPTRLHDVIHHGCFFQVEGPLNTPPSPQGRRPSSRPAASRAASAPRPVSRTTSSAPTCRSPAVKQRAALDEAFS